MNRFCPSFSISFGRESPFLSITYHFLRTIFYPSFSISNPFLSIIYHFDPFFIHHLPFLLDVYRLFYPSFTISPSITHFLRMLVPLRWCSSVCLSAQLSLSPTPWTSRPSALVPGGGLRGRYICSKYGQLYVPNMAFYIYQIWLILSLDFWTEMDSIGVDFITNTLEIPDHRHRGRALDFGAVYFSKMAYCSSGLRSILSGQVYVPNMANCMSGLRDGNVSKCG